MATEKSVPVTEGTGTTDAIATVGVTRADGSTGYRQEVVIADDTTNAARARVAAASTAAAATDPALVVGLSPNSSLPAGTNKVGTVDLATAPATAKGTQGANGVPVQHLHDAGRTYITITLDAVAGITTEALATALQVNAGGTATTGQTHYQVTAGKTFRILFFGSSCKNTSTVATNSRARVRAAATVSATSPIIVANECGAAAAVANCSATDDTPIHEGLEIAGGIQIGISHIESATTSTVSACLIGFEY